MGKEKLLALSLLLISAPAFALTPSYKVKVVKNLSGEGAQEFVIYKVKRGENLSKIMKKLKIPKELLDQILKLNNLEDPNLLYEGQEIKLPILKKKKRLKKSQKVAALNSLKLLKKMGVKVKREGFLFVGEEKIELSKYPMLKRGEQFFIVDASSSLPASLRAKLGAVGFSVIGAKELKEMEKELLSSKIALIQEKGELHLGEKNRLTYRYDYLGIDTSTGQLVAVNRAGDTPPPLEELLRAYGVSLIQPQWQGSKELLKESLGSFKIVRGKGVEKLLAIASFFTLDRPKKGEFGYLFPKAKIYLVYDYVSPEERVNLEFEGYKIVLLSGNLKRDLKELLSLVPLAVKEVRMVFYEPPNTKGRRATLYVDGLLVSAPEKDWLLVDSLDRPEEIGYLRFRGINLLVY